MEVYWKLFICLIWKLDVMKFWLDGIMFKVLIIILEKI